MTGILDNKELIEPLETLAEQASMGRVTQITPISGGNNNQLYAIDVSAGPSVVAKFYFKDPRDTRDRLAAEYSFCGFCWSHDITNVPQPLGKDDEKLIALYSFIEGQRPSVSDITYPAIEQAIAFVRNLNSAASTSNPLPFTDASESCFSGAAHLKLTDTRLKRLRASLPKTNIGHDVSKFLDNKVAVVWERIKGHAESAYKRIGIPLDAQLPQSKRIISPSDFGFHNALLSDGQFRFVDFEYSGWDDPAKLVGDFFHQVERPVPRSFYEMFRDGIIGLFSESEDDLLRIDALVPLYGIKWITIILNVFSPVSAARRQFADHSEDLDFMYERQFNLAQKALDELELRQ